MKFHRLSNSQKTTASFILIVACVVGLYLGMPNEISNKVSGDVSSGTTQTPHVKNSLATNIGQQVNQMAASTQQVTQTSHEPTVAANQEKPAAEFISWTMGDVKAATPSIPLNDQVSQYAIVEVEKPAVFPAVGQQVEIPMLNGESVRVDVQSVSSNPNGDYTWSGHLQGYENNYPVVMTYGEHSVFATVTTPKGSYTMESVNGSGWLYKNPSEFELSKPGNKDFLDVDTSK